MLASQIGYISSVLGICCGIIAIISSSIVAYKRDNNQHNIRKKIIDNQIDAETAKLLIDQKPENAGKKNEYGLLHWGTALMGLGLGYLAYALLDINDLKALFFLSATGLGLGFFLAFFIRLKLERKKKETSQIDD